MHGVGTLTVVPDKSEQHQKFTEVYTGSWDNNNFIEGTIAFSNKNHGEITIEIEGSFKHRKDVKQVHIEFCHVRSSRPPVSLGCFLGMGPCEKSAKRPSRRGHGSLIA